MYRNGQVISRIFNVSTRKHEPKQGIQGIEEINEPLLYIYMTVLTCLIKCIFEFKYLLYVLHGIKTSMIDLPLVCLIT